MRARITSSAEPIDIGPAIAATARAAAGKEKYLGAIEVDIGEGLLRTLRGLLWLKGQRDAKPAGEVLSEVEKIAERKLAGMRNALDLTAPHGWTQFEMLYRDVEALGEIADAW